MPWDLSIDTGGTFTDCLASSPDGRVGRVKVLSSSAIRSRVVARPDARTVVTDWSVPDNALRGCAIARLDAPDHPPRVVPSIVDHTRNSITLSADLDTAALPPDAAFEVLSAWQPPILAARIATATPAERPLPPIHMRLATTRGTNALLERRGHPPALFITRGFADLLDIGDQSRPDLFALDIIKPAPLHAAAIEVDERLAVDGSVLTALDLEGLRGRALAALAAGHTTAAVALLHSWINPAHERAVGALLREVGFTHVCTSAELSPLIGFLPRTQTAVVDAYLARVVGDYLAGVAAQLGPRGRLLVMTSAGGLTRATGYRPKDSLLSGPAGGLLGAASTAHEAGHERILTFDMGGTSTDVARCTSTSGRAFPLTREHRVADARVLAPAAQVESVAAGGGSICSFDRGELRVGPESAGASPGPACYGAGGPLTITDCHLLLGRLSPDGFAIPISVPGAQAAARMVLDRVNAHVRATRAAGDPRPPSLTLEALLEGFLALADERMADAIRRISIRQGEDPATYALLAFGGAGGLHACALAERLGISTVLIPPDAGLLSARGLGVAAIQRTAQEQALRCLDGAASTAEWLPAALSALAARAIAEVAAEGVPAGAITITRREAAVRILGQSASFDIPADDPALIPARFADVYTRTFGHGPPPRPLEIESLLVVASSPPGPSLSPAQTGEASARKGGVAASHRVFVGGRWQEAPVLTRASFAPGVAVAGPAVITEPHATAFLPHGWSAAAGLSGSITLSAPEGQDGADPGAQRIDAASPIALELFIASLTAIAQDMGEMLRRTALSVNVKERLDFSCALLSPDGQLLVNAPHIPVHLGALGLCVRALAAAIDMGPGDTVITNHPAFGGSHLPDITLVTPIHVGARDGPLLIGYAASRAHHAELGGVRPGSMPVGAARLEQEAVVIPPAYLVRGGVERFGALADRLAAPPHPTRALEHNLADVRAALAANRHGASALADLFARTGLDSARAHCRSLTDRAEQRTREALARLAPGTYRCADALDDGSPVVVTVTIPPPGAADTRAIVDFAGTGPTHAQNYNATPAITTAAVLYVLRLLVDEPMPLNEGMLRAIDLRIPAGTLLDPGDAWTEHDGPAVAAGNVETSQRIVDVLLLALGRGAASQGTMNNVALGNRDFGFYETVCGGAGGTKTAPGASAVHTHMTNTRITDVEIFEMRLPARLVRFQIRRGSGGAGRHPGGDGVIREYLALVDLECSVLAQRRAAGPPGIAGGSPGDSGRQGVLTGEGGPMFRPGAGSSERLRSGERLVLETPGGGGFGSPNPPSEAG